jgi:DNA-binding response OmpR family regulator
MVFQAGRVVLLTGDDVMAAKMAAQLEGDGIRLTRARTAAEAWAAITTLRPHALIADLSTRSIDGDGLMSLSVRATRAAIPFILLSKRQTRRELAPFAAVLRARDVLCAADSLLNVAARIRMWVAATQNHLAPAAAAPAMSR